ncbi:MAG TPA: DUF502 domain-containing protein [Vicinamibacterales bacterium]|jgi:uncharacterized membrane protein|nr:DUF502 domain-containing protein [Vicinamibacterales bacterium]
MAASAVQWLRRSFITGFFVTVPLVVSVVAIVWVVRWADGLTSGLGERLIGRHVPGLGLATTALIVLAAGALATNVFGRRLLQRGEQLLLHVPLFKTIYAPVKQLVSAFAPDNEGGFKRMVLVEDQARGLVLGFLTKEFTIDRGNGPETLLAVYVPTNHLYLGDIILCPPARATYPDLSVEEGIRVFLTGGMGLPARLRAGHEE